MSWDSTVPHLSGSLPSRWSGATDGMVIPLTFRPCRRSAYTVQPSQSGEVMIVIERYRAWVSGVPTSTAHFKGKTPRQIGK